MDITKSDLSGNSLTMRVIQGDVKYARKEKSLQSLCKRTWLPSLKWKLAIFFSFSSVTNCLSFHLEQPALLQRFCNLQSGLTKILEIFEAGELEKCR